MMFPNGEKRLITSCSETPKKKNQSLFFYFLCRCFSVTKYSILMTITQIKTKKHICTNTSVISLSNTITRKTKHIRTTTITHKNTYTKKNKHTHIDTLSSRIKTTHIHKLRYAQTHTHTISQTNRRSQTYTNKLQSKHTPHTHTDKHIHIFLTN